MKRVLEYEFIDGFSEEKLLRLGENVGIREVERSSDAVFYQVYNKGWKVSNAPLRNIVKQVANDFEWFGGVVTNVQWANMMLEILDNEQGEIYVQKFLAYWETKKEQIKKQANKQMILPKNWTKRDIIKKQMNEDIEKIQKGIIEAFLGKLEEQPSK